MIGQETTTPRVDSPSGELTTKQLGIMKKTLNVTLAIEVETTLDSVHDIMDNLSINVGEESENVEVERHEVVEFFEVYGLED